MAMQRTYIKYVCTFTIFKTFTMSPAMYTGKNAWCSLSCHLNVNEMHWKALKIGEATYQICYVYLSGLSVVYNKWWRGTAGLRSERHDEPGSDLKALFTVMHSSVSFLKLERVLFDVHKLDNNMISNSLSWARSQTPLLCNFQEFSFKIQTQKQNQTKRREKHLQTHNAPCAL